MLKFNIQLFAGMPIDGLVYLRFNNTDIELIPNSSFASADFDSWNILSSKTQNLSVINNTIYLAGQRLPMSIDTSPLTYCFIKRDNSYYTVTGTSQIDAPINIATRISNIKIPDSSIYTLNAETLSGRYANEFQDTLVSGTNIKTINNTSLLGSGNISALTDVKINNTSIVSNNVANIITNTAYNASSNKIATMTDVSNAISALPDPMVFKGSVGSGGTIEWASLPSASSTNEGFTYKVITDHSTTPICKVGDTIISNGSSWVVIPSGDEPSGTVTSVDMTVPTGLTVTGSPITSSGTLAISYTSGYSIPTTTQQTTWSNKQDALTTSSVNDGTLNKLIGFDSNGNVIKNDAKVSSLVNDSGFITSESDTLATVTGRGASTTTNVTLSGGADISAGTLKLKTINAPTTSGGTTYGPGTSGQVLKSNGSTMYWATDNNSTSYLSYTATSRADSNTSTNYILGKTTVSSSGTNYYNSNVYFKGNNLYTGTLTLSGNLLKTSNNATYGVTLPTTTSYTANKTLAITDDIPGNVAAASGGTTLSVVTTGDKYTWNNKSVVSVSNTGTATDEVKYITVNGTEKKLAGGTQVIFVDWS